MPDGRQTLDVTQTVGAPVEITGSRVATFALPGANKSATSTETSPPTNLGEGQGIADNHSSDALTNLPDALLLACSGALDDIEASRIAVAGRLRSVQQVKGLAGSPEAARLEAVLATLATAEEQAIRELGRAIKGHPLGRWIQSTVGIGLKQGARLLAAIGDPAARPNPAKLWAYCGHGDPERSKMRKTNVGRDEEGRPTLPFSPAAKMRTRLVAESCMKQRRSPYRAVYERERERWAARDTTDLHKHNHALRVTGKAILLDLWREATRLARGQHLYDTHARVAARPLVVPPEKVVRASLEDLDKAVWE